MGEAENRSATTLDVSGLRSEVTPADVDAARAARGEGPWGTTRSLWPAIAVLGAVGAVVVGWMIGTEVSLLIASPVVAVAAGVIAAALVFWGGAVLYRRRNDTPAEITDIRMSRFFAANDLVYGDRTATVPGVLTELGDQRHVSMKVRSTPRSVVPFEVGTINCVDGSGRTADSYDFTYLLVPLERPLPHMLLDARANDRLTSSVRVPIQRSQVLSLEGDFDRHFRLYCPAEYERDALYLFTPDLMAALVDHASDFDVEVIGTRAVFFTNRTLDLTSPEVWDDIDALLTGVTPRLTRVAQRYSDARSTAHPDARPHIAPAGQRLRSRARVPLVAWIGVAVVLAALVAIVVDRL